MGHVQADADHATLSKVCKTHPTKRAPHRVPFFDLLLLKSDIIEKDFRESSLIVGPKAIKMVRG